MLRGHGELVDETLDHEDVVRGPDAAPECGRNSRRLLANVLDADVGQCIGRLGRAVHGIHIEAPHHSDEVVEAGCAITLMVLGKSSLVTRAMIEDPVIRWVQAIGLPCSSRPAAIRS